MGKTKPATSGKTEKESPQNESRYVVLISKRFVLLSVLSCVLVAFAVGRTARMILLVNPQNRLLQFVGNDMLINNENNNQYGGKYEDNNNNNNNSPTMMKSLPDPKMKYGEMPPHTEYTSKTFDTTKSASTQSRWIVTDSVGKMNCEDQPENECSTLPNRDEEDGDGDDDNDDRVHLPAGQHLLLDIENVDGSFLNSEERLAHAMLKLIDECGLTLLSYHCHTMIPMGVSCAGVLLESHVSFHTWPSKGVITLDLFTCGPDSLLPIVPFAIELFSVREETDNKSGMHVKEPNSVWAYKTRGFVEDGIDKDAMISELSDMEYFPVGKMTDYKNEVSL
jgi:S-adenosylmethionine decarboxylase proenzyme